MNHDRLIHLVAHRGDARDFPENTLPAFASALELGLRFLELDVHLSADGVPVEVVSWGTMLAVHGFFAVLAPILRKRWTTSEVDRVTASASSERRSIGENQTSSSALMTPA